MLANVRFVDDFDSTLHTRVLIDASHDFPKRPFTQLLSNSEHVCDLLDLLESLEQPEGQDLLHLGLEQRRTLILNCRGGASIIATGSGRTERHGQIFLTNQVCVGAIIETTRVVLLWPLNFIDAHILLNAGGGVLSLAVVNLQIGGHLRLATPLQCVSHFRLKY